MDLTAGQIVQLVAALSVGVVAFVFVYGSSEKKILAFLLLMIPFQLVDSRYGTLNTVLTFLVGLAFLLQGRLRLAPMLVPVFVLLFAYAISFAMSAPAGQSHQFFWLIGFLGNFLLFYLVYNFVVRTRDWQFVIKVLFFTNLLVVIACALEMLAGQSGIVVFGIQEWNIAATRGQVGRLVGPFGSTHTTADYLIAQNVFLAFWILNETKRRNQYLLGCLFAANSMCIVATGDRGGFMGLVLGALLFAFFFRRFIGTVRTVRLLFAGIVLFGIASLVMVQYTDFGVLFDRLGNTEIEEGGVPENRVRSVELGLQYFGERPIAGYGPSLAVSKKTALVADIPYRPYPHNLLLHILATTGIVGFMAWTIFFLAILQPLLVTLRSETHDKRLSQMPRVALIILMLFMAGELRIEFLRDDMVDVQNYMFVLFGLFIACVHLIRSESNVPAPRPVPVPRRAAVLGYARDSVETQAQRS